MKITVGTSRTDQVSSTGKRALAVRSPAPKFMVLVPKTLATLLQDNFSISVSYINNIAFIKIFVNRFGENIYGIVG